MRSRDTSSEAPKTVTLLVTQDIALRINTAAQLGKLTFALRGSHDLQPVGEQLVDESRLFPRPPRAPALGRVRGVATGPDGRTYILEDDSRWVRATEEIARLVSPSAGHTSPLEERQP